MDISNLSKPMVLKALYDASKPIGRGFLHFIPGPLSLEEAESLIKQSSYFDYLYGRVLKVDLKGDEVALWLYDRDNGQGAGELAILEAFTKP